jgi:hypothetical protein
MATKKYLYIVSTFLGLFLVAAPRVHAVVTLDTSSTDAFSGSSSYTSSINVGSSGGNELLVIEVETVGAPTGVSVDGVPAQNAISFLGNAKDIDIWYVKGLSSGSHTVSTTFGTTRSGNLGMASYFGVAQTNTLDTVATATVSSATAISSTITTTVANDVLVDGTARTTETTNAVSNASQTKVYGNVGTTNKNDMSYYVATSTQAYTLGWTYTASNVAIAYGVAAFEAATSTPSVSWVSPSNSVTVTSTVTLTALSTGSGASIKKVSFYEGSYGATLASSTFIASTTVGSGNQYSVSWNTGILANGSTTLWALTTDTNNNTASTSITVNINNVAPYVVQTCVNSSYVTPTTTCTFSTNITSGDVLVLIGNSNVPIATPASGCATWTTVASTTSQSSYPYEDISIGTASLTGACTLKLGLSTSSGAGGFMDAWELKGVQATTDGSAFATSHYSCTTSCTGPSITTSLGGDLVLSAINAQASQVYSSSSFPIDYNAKPPGTLWQAQFLAHTVQPSAGAIAISYFGSSSLSYDPQAIVAMESATQPAPDATSVSTTVGGDGGRSGDSITITGTNFGTVATSNAATCNGSAGTGCIEFIVGGTDIVPSSSVTSWSNTSITFTVPSTINSNGGVNALQVWAANASSTATPLTFYIYPRISAVASLGTNAAREYNAGDTDGLIMLAGDHFGTTTGTSTILGFSATLYNATGGPCTVAGFASTTACFEVPTSIASNTYSGNIILNRASDNKQATTSLSILPRILSVNPTSAYGGQVVQVLGDHFCEPSGTCPVSPNRSTSTMNVAFGGTLAPDSNFVAQTGGAGVCNGSGAAWANGEICVQVPGAAAIGSAPIVVTSNNNTSTAAVFTVTTPPAPGAPGTPTYTNVGTTTLTVNWAAASGAVSYYTIERATSTQIYVQIATTTATSTNDSGLTANTTYYYMIGATNAGGSGPYSASSSVTTAVGNLPPNAPTLNAPASGIQNVSTTPVFQMSATDPNGDNIQYRVVLYADSLCTATSSIYNETSTQAGWSGQNATSSSPGDSYLSGTQGVYTLQPPALSLGAQYYWAASAVDPLGSDTWSPNSTCRSFTTTSGMWTTDSGSWSISSGYLTVSPPTGSSVQLHISGLSESTAVVDFNAKISGIGSGNVAGVAHADSGSNNYHVVVADFQHQKTAIGKTFAGTYTTLASTSFSLTSGIFYRFRGSFSVPLSGSPTTLASWARGSSTLTVNDNSLNGQGYIGLVASSSNLPATFSFSDFAVYTGVIITMDNLPAGGSWGVLDSQGNPIGGCQSGNALNISNYSGQIPVDYDNGGGQVAVWALSNNCTGGGFSTSSASAFYPSQYGLANDIFGGDTYTYNANPGGGSVGGGIPVATSTITVNSAGEVSY